MNVDDLRALLHEQGESVEDQGAVARVAEVRGRVVAARRRRTAVVAGAAAAVVAVAGAVVLGPLGQRNADGTAPASLAGLSVPHELTSAGFAYDYVRGVQSDPGDDRLDLTVEAEDTPLLVSFGSDRPGGFLRLQDRGTDQETGGRSGSFSNFYVVHGPRTAHLRLTQDDGLGDGRLAMAVYELGRSRPAGVSNGEVTLRNDVDGNPLLVGKIGEPGQTELTARLVLPRGELGENVFCYGATGKVRLSLDLGDGPVLSTEECGTTAPFDGGGAFNYVTGAGAAPEGEVTVRARITAGPGVSLDDVVIGMAVYERTTPTRRVLGMDVPVVTEDAGHTWELTGVRTRSGESMTQRLPASDTPRMVDGAANPRGASTWRLVVDGRVVATFGGATGGTSMGGGVLLRPGVPHTVSVRVTGSQRPPARLAVVTYDQAD